MKRIISLIICVLLVAGLAVPASAAGMKVVFTNNSSFAAGGTVTVDTLATQRTIMDDPSVTADVYNAALEGNIQFYWFRNDSWYADGTTLKLTDADKGCEFFCRAYLFSDADHTQQCGVLDSVKFTVPNTGNPALIPEITTKSLKNGTVGESYYQKLECTDPDATYSLFRSSLPDGLYLTQHGEIEGVPVKAGFWYVVIMATPEAGADYANTAEFEITIDEGGSDYTLEIQQLPNKLTYTAGEKLDMTGMWVRIYTPDGFIDSRDGKYLTYSKKALTTVGEQKIKLTYEDAMEIFIVTVVAAPKEEPEDSTEITTDSPEVTTGPVENVTAPESTDPSTETSEKVKPQKQENVADGKSDVDTKDEQKDKSNKNLMPIVIAVVAVVVLAAAGGITFVVIKRKR